VLESNTVEALGQFEHGGIATLADGGQRLAHGTEDVAVLANGPREQRFGVRDTAEIESSQHRLNVAPDLAGGRKSSVSLHADLASLQSTLDQALERLSDAAESITGTELDDHVGDLYEIERHLRAANRRLARTVGDLS